MPAGQGSWASVPVGDHHRSALPGRWGRVAERESSVASVPNSPSFAGLAGWLWCGGVHCWPSSRVVSSSACLGCRSRKDLPVPLTDMCLPATNGTPSISDG